MTWCPSLITCVKREVTSWERISWIDLQSQPNVTMMWVRDVFQSLSFVRFKVQSNEFWEEEGGNRKGLLGKGKRQKGIRHTNINSRLEYYAHDRSTVVLFSEEERCATQALQHFLLLWKLLTREEFSLCCNFIFLWKPCRLEIVRKI